MDSSEIEVIKRTLFESCRSYNALMFLPYLLSPAVRVGFPNKIRFYSSLKNALTLAKERSFGELELKIEKVFWEDDPELLAYNFYDQIHQYPRINLQVKETEDSLFIDVMPF